MYVAYSRSLSPLPLSPSLPPSVLHFQECEFKCTTVNGMKYHFVRCMKSNPPEFNCELCEKRFQCRTGLVWHLKKTHKVSTVRGKGERERKGGREI